MNQRSYLDYNATAPLRDEVREAMIAALSLDGNPSSVHAEGRAARRAIETARAKVASLVGAEPEAVIFTSGGTEANALALAARLGEAWHCYVSAIDHPSVLSGGRFYREEDLHRLASDIEPRKVAFTRRQEIILWNPLALLIFVALITLEWVMRKFANLS